MAKSARLFLCKGNEGYGNMRVKKALIWLLALMLLLSVPAMAEGDTELRGYWKGHGWKFVQLFATFYKSAKNRPDNAGRLHAYGLNR
jgi:hypothetical protein